jgi:5-methylcytosine-specific restriction enzyme subunit McrC
MHELLEVREFDLITCNKDYIQDKQYKYLNEESFCYLEQLILTYNQGLEADAIDFFTLTTRRGVGKVISARNYVGIVQMKNGTQIQVIPKIDAGADIDTKKIFIRMLRSMKDFPSKVFSETGLKIDRMNLYEVFINMYIQEVRNLVKKGIKSSYQQVEENAYFYKGKQVVTEHLKKNIVHKERFYVRYDEFGVNRAENKLIKSTLLKLIRISNSLENIKEISQLLNSFETVEASKNYERDFSQVVIDRSSKDYENLMRWSKVFLMDRSFTTFSGNVSSRALLFPMEKVFEAYVGRNIKKLLAGTEWNVKLQDTRYYLFERQFELRPDIVIENEAGSRRIILDTKWKSLNNNSGRNYGISQVDMYQMYAYAKKYQTNEIWLLYPLNYEMSQASDIQFKSDDGVIINLFFVDLNKIEESLDALIKRLVLINLIS